MRRAAAIAAAIAAAYLVVAPASADLGAQLYRAGLFDRAGFALWDNAWYGGHPLPGYSVLFPPLGAWLGVRVVGALSVVAAAALFAVLVRDARVAAVWFAVAIAAQLLTGRMTFLLGVALALGTLVLERDGRRPAALVLGALTTLASPVAGAFLALAAVAWGRLAVAAAAIVPGLALALLFPEGGSEPFVPSAFWPAFAALVLIAALLPARERALRRGAALAALLCLAAFAVDNPLGGNASRLGALFAAPVLLAVPLEGRRRALALAALPLLAYWQLMPPVRDVVVSAGDPTTKASYYAELLPHLAGRVEVPFTRSHWESRYLAEHVLLARGWQRQLDRQRNKLFYEDTLTAPELRAWLVENAVRLVALPDAELDPSGRQEATLIRAGVPGVPEVWRGRHWRLYAVRGARPLGAEAASTDAFAAIAPALVRIRWSPYWAITGGSGCVRRAARGDWTLVTGSGPVRVAQRFSLSRGLARSTARRCADLAPARRPG